MCLDSCFYFFPHIAVKSNLKWWKTPYIRHRNRKKQWKNIDFHEILFSWTFLLLSLFLCRLAKNPFISYRAHNKSIIASTQRRIIYKIIFHAILDHMIDREGVEEEERDIIKSVKSLFRHKASIHIVLIDILQIRFSIYHVIMPRRRRRRQRKKEVFSFRVTTS